MGFSCFLFAQETKSTREIKKQERQDRIDSLMKKEEEGALIFTKQNIFGAKLNTDGWAALFEHGKYKTLTTTNLWWLELGERKSPKEERKTVFLSNGLQVGNPFIYGKINNFYFLKVGIGQQRLIGGKGNKNGVAVSINYGAGFSAGYLKPYYLTVVDSVGNTSDIKYEESTAAIFTDPSAILGSAGFTKGFSEGEFVPGGHAKVGLRFDYGRYNKVVSAVEVGVNAEFYSKKIPIILNTPDKSFFFNAFVAIEFGGRN